MAQTTNQNLPKILRIGVIQGGKIIEERLVKKRETVTVGQSPKNTIVIPVSNLPPSFPVFELSGSGYVLNFTEQMDGKLAVNDAQLDFSALKAQGLAKKSSAGFGVALNDASKGKIALGEVTLLFQFVTPPPEAPKPVLPDIAKGSIWATMDKVFFGILAATLLSNFSFVKAVSLRDPPPEEELTLDELPDRFVKMIVPEKPIEPPKKEQVADNGDEKKDDKPKDDKPKGDDKPKVAANAEEHKAAVAKSVASKGLLKILGASGGGGALEDVLGGSASSGDIASALAGAGGVGVATADDLAGGERKGGGAGTAAGIGDLATSGGAGGKGNLDGAGVGSKQITGRVIDNGPEIESSSCDRDAISRYVKRNLRAIQGCYERELKRNPSLKGKVVVRFTIGETGKVSEIEIDEQTIGNDAVVNCIKNTIRLWIFPIKDNECPVAYPFVFAPSG